MNKSQKIRIFSRRNSFYPKIVILGTKISKNPLNFRKMPIKEPWPSIRLCEGEMVGDQGKLN